MSITLDNSKNILLLLWIKFPNGLVDPTLDHTGIPIEFGLQMIKSNDRTRILQIFPWNHQFTEFEFGSN